MQDRIDRLMIRKMALFFLGQGNNSREPHQKKSMLRCSVQYPILSPVQAKSRVSRMSHNPRHNLSKRILVQLPEELMLAQLISGQTG